MKTYTLRNIDKRKRIIPKRNRLISRPIDEAGGILRKSVSPREMKNRSKTKVVKGVISAPIKILLATIAPAATAIIVSNRCRATTLHPCYLLK